MSGVETPLEKTDERLVEEFKQGKEYAFELLMRRHKEKAMKYAYVMVGNYEDAKEIAQDAFVKVHRNLSEFELRSKFTTWFYRILVNTSKDYLRKRKLQNFLKWKDNEEMESYWEQTPDTGAVSDKNILASELGEKMTEAIKRLPEKQRWIFTLRFIEGMSLAEIASVVESSEGTVKASLHFAAEKFKERMKPYLKKGS